MPLSAARFFELVLFLLDAAFFAMSPSVVLRAPAENIGAE
jgi:hypothetical protein